jgi:outer membrane immunogenic protein
MRRVVLLVSALSVGAFQSVSAADIPAPVYKAPPAAVDVRNWTGCYIGINGGYGWAHKEFVGDAGGLGSHTADGGVAGGQVGCDYQTGPWVFGIRGMFDWADMTGSHIDPTSTADFNTRVSSFGTAVVRVGYTYSPNTLVYALGGFARVRDRFLFTSIAGSEIGFANTTRTGFDVGIGLEHMFAPGWSAFVEYDFMGFGSLTPVEFQAAPPPFTVALVPVGGSTPVVPKQNMSVVLVGVNYRFGTR